MPDQNLTLYTYWRSSASYRVRMALNLKGLEYESRPVHLVREGGQQFSAEFTAINPQQMVPALVHGSRVLTQSLAILEYIEECFAQTPLLPQDAGARARVRTLAQAIACEIHPLNNLRVLKYLTGPAGLNEEGKLAWYRHWTETGLVAVERLLDDPATGRFCHGDEPTLADCCLLPQVYNARRFNCDLTGCNRIVSICDVLQQIGAIEDAAPENQPDADPA
ncbi:maleylacetoacetate isomerase [Wenzhouxiangella sp. AB-CW3]|uniref:maleylacetoacetate isomerase n=1 Tax=Wenzhouxiangella sp. AB-CW3 TaxID=2771012 RepID=UPI00168A7E22|nr:maleylacetoacetate isomerase [Wenzhouxiangella sp. AB-CW3]QOC21665.1 maleylacetoacetate isomerase [Wenzhouxiangella sp. AB-CW3]